MSDAVDFVNQMAEKVAPLEKRLCALHWKLAATGESEAAHQLAEAEKELKLIFSNPNEFKKLKSWRKKGIADSSLARQVDLLVNAYAPNQLDEPTIADLVERQTEIENIFNNFRARLDGKELTDNDLKELLKTETDNARRRAAWEASKQIGSQVAEKVKELARRRNRAAQSLGFKNHFEMALQLQELDPASVLKLFDGLKKATQKPFQQKIGRLHDKLARHFKIPKEAVMPWHYDDPFAQSAPARATVDLDPFVEGKDVLKIMRDFYQTIDLDIADVLERSDLFERKGKCQHAFCLNMDRGKDVRVLANIRPNSYWTSTMLHELGHAAYSKNIASTLPHFLRDEAHIFATEAIAMLMERMIHHPHWLEVMLKAPPAELKKMEGELWESLALDKLIIARWVMVVTNFEKNFYENPDQDLNALWWRLVREFQLIEKPTGRQAPDWAAKIHIASYPCYYQNYLLGELMAAQIAQMLEKEALGKPLAEISFWNKPKVGQILKDRLFEKGCQWHWKKLVPHVTGKELGIESFVKQFA